MRNSIVLFYVLLSSTIYSFPQYTEDTNGYDNQYSQTQNDAYRDITFIPEKTAATPVAAPALPRSQTSEQQYLFPRRQQHVHQLQRERERQQPQVQLPLQPQQQSYAISQEENRGHHPSTTPIPIIKLDKSQALDGSYKQSWETGNNIIAEETGFLKNIGNKDHEALVQQGKYTYTAPDGTIITTIYTADEEGFHVEGSHLPTTPPIPEEIQRGLDQIYEGIRLQQEIEAKEAKYGKNKGSSFSEENNLIAENYPQQQPQRKYQQLQQHLQQPQPQQQEYEIDQYRSR